MKKEVVIGSWVPRTVVHLKEFYDFVNGNDLGFDKEEAAKYRQLLAIREIEYYNEELDYITAQSKNVAIRYVQDGVYYVSGENKQAVADYYNSRLLPALNFIYSRGAPIPKMIADVSAKEPLIRTINPKTRIKSEGQLEFPSTELFEYVVFLRGYESILHTTVRVHRITWDSVSAIRSKEKIRFKELPEVRDTLLDLKKDISFIRSRLNQVKGYVANRQRLATKRIQEDLKILKSNLFQAYFNLEDYFVELLVMTEQYADATLNLVDMLYHENEQKEMNTLQMIFTVGVVASFFTLGALPGSIIALSDATGKTVLTGSIAAFSFKDLLTLGAIALFFGVAIFLILHVIYQGFKSFKIVNIAKREKLEEGIK